MCWVIPPDSVEITLLDLMRSSRAVLPWSTWPMMVTTGGLSSASPSPAETLASSSLSAPNSATSLILKPCSSATRAIVSVSSLWLAVAMTPRPRQVAIMVFTGMPVWADSSEGLVNSATLITESSPSATARCSCLSCFSFLYLVFLLLRVFVFPASILARVFLTFFTVSAETTVFFLRLLRFLFFVARVLASFFCFSNWLITLAVSSGVRVLI